MAEGKPRPQPKCSHHLNQYLRHRNRNQLKGHVRVETLFRPLWRLRSQETHEQHLTDIDSRGACTIDTLLFGDSMLERWKTTGDKFDFGPSVFNAGCGGDTVQNMLWRLCKQGAVAGAVATGKETETWGGDDGGGEPNPRGLLEGLALKQVVLLAGTNHLSSKKMTGPEIAVLVQALASLVLAQQPQLQRLVLYAVPPRDKVQQSKIDECNALLERFCDSDPRLHFCSVLTTFRIGGDGDGEFEKDGVHFNAAGYEKWYPTLADQLRANF